MRNILIHFAIKYNGDYIKILSAIKDKEIVTNEDIDKIKKANICALTCLDDNYPSFLREIYAPPFVLFYKGDISLLNSDMISVIGSREPTSYGKEVTEKVYEEILGLYKNDLINGIKINEVDKEIIYYTIEKSKVTDLISVECDNCGAINDVDRGIKTRCKYCNTIIEENKQK